MGRKCPGGLAPLLLRDAGQRRGCRPPSGCGGGRRRRPDAPGQGVLVELLRCVDLAHRLESGSEIVCDIHREVALVAGTRCARASVSSARCRAASTSPSAYRSLASRLTRISVLNNDGTSHGSTFNGTNRCVPSLFLTSAAVHSSVVYRSSSKYAGEKRHHPVCGTQSVAHLGDETLVHRTLPRTHHSVAGVDQVPGDPLRPRLIPPGVADEEIHSRHALHTSGHRRPPELRSGCKLSISGAE